MGVTTRKIDDGQVTPAKLSTNAKHKLWVYTRGDLQPRLALATDGTSAPSGTAGTRNLFVWGDLRGSHFAKGTQTLLVPLLDMDKGLEISQDQTNNDGVEYVFGGDGLFNPFLYTVGTDVSRYIKVKLEIEDVSGTDQLMVGFRKNEAVQADWNDYDELAAINVVSGTVKSSTILNNAATVNTSSTTTWADGAIKTLEVQLRGRRAVFLVDGTPLAGGIPQFNFDSAEVVMPFLYFLQDSDVTKVWVKEIEIGTLSDISTSGQ